MKGEVQEEVDAEDAEFQQVEDIEVEEGTFHDNRDEELEEDEVEEVEVEALEVVETAPKRKLGVACDTSSSKELQKQIPYSNMGFTFLLSMTGVTALSGE